MNRTAVVVAGVALLAAGCGGTKTVTVTKAPPSCVQALNQADEAFTALGNAITGMKQAVDAAMAGHPAEGTAIIKGISGPPDPTIYKGLEARCRSAR